MIEPDARPTVVRLQHELDRVLSSLLRRGTRAALINYPNHHNVGDPALYLGTLSTLRRIGVRVTYRCEHSTYSRESLAAELRRGTEVILINGGGNLGDQYPQQASRERVIADFPTVPTIQLSQSVWFESSTKLNAFADLVTRHRDLTLLVRDQQSLDLARRHFAAASRMCPDMAFGLGVLRRPVQPSQDIVWLQRSDRESARHGPPGATVEAEPVDWLPFPPEAALGGQAGVWLAKVNRWLARRVTRNPSLWRAHAWTFVPLARRRTAFGCHLLAKGNVVVTDRLHGLILAMLMGIPAIAVDNRNQKIGAFIESWLLDTTGVHTARTHGDALAMAQRWLNRRAGA